MSATTDHTMNIYINGTVVGTIHKDLDDKVHVKFENFYVWLDSRDLLDIAELLEKEQMKIEAEKESIMQHDRKLAVARASFELTEEG